MVVWTARVPTHENKPFPYFSTYSRCKYSIDSCSGVTAISEVIIFSYIFEGDDDDDGNDDEALI